MWVKPSAELSFLYGNHVLKAGLGRITENTPQYVFIFPLVILFRENQSLREVNSYRYQGVVVYNMADIPLGSDSFHDLVFSYHCVCLCLYG